MNLIAAGFWSDITSCIFALLIADISTLAMQVAAFPRAFPRIDGATRKLILHMVETPEANNADWEFISRRFDVSWG